MDNATLEQLKQDVKQEIENKLKNSELNNIITRYGLAEDVIEIPVILHLDKIKSSNDIQGLLIQDSSTLNEDKSLLFACCNVNGQYICKP